VRGRAGGHWSQYHHHGGIVAPDALRGHSPRSGYGGYAGYIGCIGYEGADRIDGIPVSRPAPAGSRPGHRVREPR
jgi:hypothetical protein